MPTLEMIANKSDIVNKSDSLITKPEKPDFFRRYFSRIGRVLRNFAYAAIITAALAGGVKVKADFVEQPVETLEADLNNDGIVNVYDLRIFSKNWLNQRLADLNEDNIVDFLDFNIMATQWHMTEPWYVEYKLENVTVINVIDGDTIDTDIGRIRLLGINTPESGMPYYNEAKDYLKQIENEIVGLLRDSRDIEIYERKLRYVFYEGKLLNIEILEKGLGICYMIDNLKYEYDFVDAEKLARENQIGLWEKSRDIYANCIELVELNPIDEFFILENKCDFYCDLSGWIVHDNANHIFYLDELKVGEIKRYESKGNIWNNDDDRFFMRDNEGKLVKYYPY